MNLLDLLFPKRCVSCNKLGTFLCSECIQEIKQTDLVCPFCERMSLGGLVHPVCKRKYGLDGLWSLGIYQGVLKSAIQKLKYRWIRELAEDLINITIDYWAKHGPFLLDEIKKSRGEGWVLVPVPLHIFRQNWRGFNQAALIGQNLSKKLGLAYSECLIRIKKTKPQVGLEAWERKKNIRDAFSLNTKYLIHNTNVILVDDVWTTGSTLRECCFVLKKNGAKKVWALTLAR